MGILLYDKKGIRSASADVGFMFNAYNLRRIMNIVDKTVLIKLLQGLALLFFINQALLKRFIFKIRACFLKQNLNEIFLTVS